MMPITVIQDGGKISEIKRNKAKLVEICPVM